MWRTPEGDRVLTKAEWQVFLSGLEYLVDDIEGSIKFSDDPPTTGVRVFDALTTEQMLASLADVAAALSDPLIPTPDHTAVNEGTIAAVFSYVAVRLEIELDQVDESTPSPSSLTHVQQSLLAFQREANRESSEESVELESNCSSFSHDELTEDDDFTEEEEWSFLIESVKDGILWDADYDMDAAFLDLPPTASKELLDEAGICDDYYTAISRDPSDDEMIGVRQTLARLLGRPVPNDCGSFTFVEDWYHELEVGPCSDADAAVWEEHPWVQICYSSEPRAECDYATWLSEFSHKLPNDGFAPPQLETESTKLLNDVTFEPSGSEWMVTASDGSRWCDLIVGSWTDDPDDGDSIILKFSSREAAASSYVHALRMYDERKERRKAALTQLGKESDD